MRDCLDSDVHSHQTNIGELDRNRLCNDLLALDRLVTINHLMIGRKQKLNSLLFGALLNLERGFAACCLRPKTFRP